MQIFVVVKLWVQQMTRFQHTCFSLPVPEEERNDKGYVQDVAKM